ncbi:hypothetical protein CW731_02915 [Polaribacter sp. ALD11]|uniref:hypothetical protein n=1 Tax=Polaribacter sp. ALD11 TaxID=2058137 RepID=UPI000C3055A4|nr:hypothetical protein [Polaribacter sp. ALD11]AUC84313.1 hypothetical protein CW731_02915 [Polaribacter sp. ALD11]
MKNKSRKLNIIAIITLLILLFICALIIQDSPLSWALLPGDSVILFPLLFFIPLILSVLSLMNKKNIFAKIILSISIILLIITGIFALYALALGAAWKN